MDVTTINITTVGLSNTGSEVNYESDQDVRLNVNARSLLFSTSSLSGPKGVLPEHNLDLKLLRRRMAFYGSEIASHLAVLLLLPRRFTHETLCLEFRTGQNDESSATLTDVNAHPVI